MSAHTNSAQSILFDYRPHFCNQYLQDYRHGRIFHTFLGSHINMQNVIFHGSPSHPLHICHFFIDCRFALAIAAKTDINLYGFIRSPAGKSGFTKPASFQKICILRIFRNNQFGKIAGLLEYFCGSITAWGSAFVFAFGKQSATCVLVLIQEHQFPLKVQHFFQYNHSWAQKSKSWTRKRVCPRKSGNIAKKNRKAGITKAAPKELASATTYKPPSEQELPFVNQLLKALFLSALF